MKAVSILNKIVYGLIALVFLFIIGVNLLIQRQDQYWSYYDFSVSQWILFVSSLIIAFALIFFGNMCAKRESTQNTKRYLIVLIISTVVLLVLQIVIVDNIFFQVGWDVSYLKEAAEQYVDNNLDEFHKHYFEKNPNNIFMYIITIASVAIGKSIGFNGYKALVYFGVVLNNLSVFMTSLVVYRVSKKRAWGYIAYVVSALLFGLSPWMIAPYSDIFSVLISISGLYIFLVVRDSKIKWYVKPILVVILPGIAYAIKPTNIFILFAIAIYELIQLIGRPDRLKALLRILIGIGAAVAVIFLTKAVSYKIIDYKVNDNYVMPMSHYLLLGSNYNMVGQYNGMDDDYTCSFPSKEEKSKADTEEVIRRYKEMFPVQYIRHLCNKTYLNFSNGILGWGKEAGFVNEMYENDSTLGNALRSYYYLGGDNILREENAFPEGGENFSIFANMAQIIWYMLLILCFLQSIRLLFLKKSMSEVDVVSLISGITILGIFVFLSLFETNARYLYSLLPIFVAYIFAIGHDYLPLGNKDNKNVGETYGS